MENIILWGTTRRYEIMTAIRIAEQAQNNVKKAGLIALM